MKMVGVSWYNSFEDIEGARWFVLTVACKWLCLLYLHQSSMLESNEKTNEALQLNLAVERLGMLDDSAKGLQPPNWNHCTRKEGDRLIEHANAGINLALYEL